MAQKILVYQQYNYNRDILLWLTPIDYNIRFLPVVINTSMDLFEHEINLVWLDVYSRGTMPLKMWMDVIACHLWSHVSC